MARNSDNLSWYVKSNSPQQMQQRISNLLKRIEELENEIKELKK
jgi:TolA-binding protein